MLLDMGPGLSPELRSCLIRNGITALWDHQARAVDALRAGRSVVLTTGTASGKSLSYQLPIVESVLDSTQDTALLVFPTKALAQDQLRSFREWLLPELVASIDVGSATCVMRCL